MRGERAQDPDPTEGPQGRGALDHKVYHKFLNVFCPLRSIATFVFKQNKDLDYH